MFILINSIHCQIERDIITIFYNDNRNSLQNVFKKRIHGGCRYSYYERTEHNSKPEQNDAFILQP